MSLRRVLWSLVVLVSLASTGLAAPFITGFTPDTGLPGTQVTIVGSGLRPTAPAPRVLFGNVEASLVLANNIRIVAIVPDKVPLAPITVMNAGGTYTTPFLFYAFPRIEDFGTKIIGSIGDTILFEKPVIATPASTLTIIGANFYVPNIPEVLVQVGTNLIPASATAENQILATIPPILPTGYLSLRTAVGWVTNTTDYIYGSPRIEAFTTNGAAGDTIHLKGLNFLVKTPSQLTLTIGGAPVTQFEVLSNTNLTAVVPAAAVTGPLRITVPGGSFITTSNFNILPRVSAFAPNGGPAGTVVTLVGSGLSGTKAVLFGNVAAATTSITNVSAARVDVVVPPGVASGPITVTTAGGSSVTDDLFYSPPFVSGFTPSSGSAGVSVTLSGFNLLGTTAVKLNGAAVPVFTVVDNTKIILAVPANATSGSFSVIGPGGTGLSASSFTVLGKEPLITGFSPKFGPVGTAVTIVGSNLGTATRVAFNGVETPFTAPSSVTLVANVPAGATTGKIRVTNPDGSSDSVEDFVVGSTADLRLSLGAAPNPAVAFGPVTFNILVVNNGPLPAAATRVEVELPPGLAFLEAISTYPYEVNGQKITFNRGLMEPQGFFTGGVRAAAGSPNESRIVTARAVSTTPDTSPGDNERQINLTVALPVLSSELLSPTELLLSWPSAASGLYSPKTSPGIGGPWVPTAGTPENDGARVQLTVPVDSDRRFFRLELN
ncbi:MAG: IPT/TIG domain-containing protein [Verrucomicrobiales bacterium]|nr:IPT/TIG domain-containing protein [Verrucomicrobiales bacterium]